MAKHYWKQIHNVPIILFTVSGAPVREKLDGWITRPLMKGEKWQLPYNLELKMLGTCRLTLKQLPFQHLVEQSMISRPLSAQHKRI